MGSLGRFGELPSGCPSKQADLLNQRDAMRAVEGSKRLWAEVYRESICRWLGHDSSEAKTPPPKIVYCCTIFAHVTGDFRRVSFPEKNLCGCIFRLDNQGRLATPGSHPIPFQSTLLYTCVYSKTSVN